MNERNALDTHSWSGGAYPHQIQQSGRVVLHHQCLRCGREFAREFDGADGSDWHAAYVGAIRIELLADSVNERWLGEECPGRLLQTDDAVPTDASGLRRRRPPQTSPNPRANHSLGREVLR